MTERKAHLDAFAVVTIVFCCFLWGLNQVAAKAAMPEIRRSGRRPRARRRRDPGLALGPEPRHALFDGDRTLPGGLLAGVLFAAEFFCIFVGLQFTTASRMVVWIYIAPFVVALGMPLISRSERLSALQSVGLVLAFAGVAWAFAEGFSQPHAGANQWIGDALGMLAGVLWGATTLAVRATALGQASAEKTLLYQLAVSALAAAGGGKPLGRTAAGSGSRPSPGRRSFSRW
jgi:drug/metabolite transporter (DMT)-like permease